MTAAEVIATLTRAREDQGLKRGRVAALLGKCRASIHRWETRRCSPPLDSVVAWAAVLGYWLALIPTDQADGDGEAA